MDEAKRIHHLHRRCMARIGGTAALVLPYIFVNSRRFISPSRPERFVVRWRVVFAVATVHIEENALLFGGLGTILLMALVATGRQLPEQGLLLFPLRHVFPGDAPGGYQDQQGNPGDTASPDSAHSIPRTDFQVKPDQLSVNPDGKYSKSMLKNSNDYLNRLSFVGAGNAARESTVDINPRRGYDQLADRSVRSDFY